MESALFDTYNRSELSFEKGQGAWLWDQDGQQYLDLSSGLGVNILGHQHPAFVEHLKQHVQQPLHFSNGFTIPEQERLASKLCQLTGLDKAFIVNCGAEANETALKLARLHAKQRDISSPQIIVMENAFHGRTLGTLSASASRKVQAGFEPLVSGFIRTPFNDLEAVQHIAQTHNDVVAVMLEPIQGYGGIHKATQEYLSGLRKLCDQNNWLLIADEIQCGHGRSGAYLSIQHDNIQADIVTLAKGLGGGIPIGACLSTDKVARLMGQGTHGTTFGGNPFACKAALSVLSIFDDEKLVERVKTNSQLLLSSLGETLGKHRLIKDIRGIGYMIGIELSSDATALKKMAHNHGILIDVTAQTVIRLLPPYILNANDIENACVSLQKVLNQFESNTS